MNKNDPELELDGRKMELANKAARDTFVNERFGGKKGREKARHLLGYRYIREPAIRRHIHPDRV